MLGKSRTKRTKRTTTHEESKSEKEINKHGGRKEEIVNRERNAGQPADSEHQGAQTSNAETPDAEATRTTVKEKHRTEDRIEIILLMWIGPMN